MATTELLYTMRPEHIIFDNFFTQRRRYSRNFASYVALQLVEGSWPIGVHFRIQKYPMKKIQGRQIARPRRPCDVGATRGDPLIELIALTVL